MPDNSYQEILGVSIDTSAFEAGLNELRSLWEAFTQQVGAGNVGNVLGVGAFQGIMDGFNAMREVIAEVSTEVYQNIEKLANNTAGALEKIEAAKREAVESSAERSINGSGGSAANRSQLQDTLRVRPGENLEALQDKAIKENEAMEAKLLQTWEKEYAEEARLAEEAAAKRVAIAENTILEEVKVREQLLKAQSKQTAEEIKLAEKASAERVAIAEKTILEEVVAREKLLQSIAAQYAKEQAEIEKLAALEAKRAEAQVKQQEARAAADQKKAESDKGLFGSLEKDIARVTKFYLLWAAVGGVFQGLTAVIQAPFQALHEGMQYLEGVERTAEQLSGVLVANIKYSEDFAENLNKARQAAEAVVPALREIAIRDHIKPEQLQNTFDNVVTAAAGRGTNNTEDLLKVTEAIATAFQSLGINARSARTEIYNALNGTPTASSKFLEVMKMTSAEWVKVREHAYATGTLAETMGEKFEPFLAAARRAEQGQASLLERVELLKQQLEGTFAKPLYDEFTEILKKMAAWVDANRGEVEKWATALGQIPAQFLSIATSFEGLQPIAKILLVTFGELGLAINVILSSLKFLWNSLESGAHTLDPSRNTFEEQKKIWAEFRDEQAKVMDQSSALINGPQKTTLEKANALAFHTTPAPPPPNTTKPARIPSEIPDEMAKFQDELTKIKAQHQEFKDQTAEAVTSHKMSWATASSEIVKDVEKERNEINALIATYKVLAGELPDAKTPQGKQRIKTTQDRLTRTGDALGASLDKEEDSAQKNAASEAEQLLQEQTRHRLVLVSDALKNEMAEKQKMLKSGLINEEDFLSAQIAAEQKASDEKIAIFKEEIQGKATDTPFYEAAQNKIKESEASTTDVVRRLIAQRIEAHRLELEKEAQHTAEMIVLADDYIEVLERIGATAKGQINLAVFTQKQHDIDLLIQQKEKALEHALAIGAETDAVRKLETEIAKLNNSRANNVQAEISAINGSGNPAAINKNRIQGVLQNERNSLQSSINAQSSNISAAANSGADPQKLAEMSQQLDKTVASLHTLDETLRDNSLSWKNLGESVQQNVFGFDLLNQLQKDKGQKDKELTDVTVAATNAFASVTNTVGAVKDGVKKGGVLGGIGAGITANKDLISAIPIAGPIIAAMGPVLSSIGQMFMSAAIRIGADIKKSMEATTTAYQQHTQNLITTINQLEAERSRAISSLSGIKGGKDQLDKILPELDSQLNSLQQQQEQIFKQWGTSFNALALTLDNNSSALSGIYNQWQQINQQVIDYVNAGGDAAQAAQYLSMQLQQIQKTGQDTLDQGEKQAVQDAISLNGLLLQRTDLVKSLNEQVFALQNQDAMERTQAGSVTRAEQITNLKDSAAKQLKDLDYQIQTATLKVNAEGKVFSIAQSIEDLHRHDDDLTMKGLNDQLDTYKAIRDVVASITQNAAGMFSSTIDWLAPGKNPLGTQITLNGGLYVTINAPAGADMSRVTGDSIYDAMQDAARGGAQFGY